MDNVFYVKPLDYSVYFIGQNVARNAFIFSKWLIDNVTFNVKFIIVIF